MEVVLDNLKTNPLTKEIVAVEMEKGIQSVCVIFIFKVAAGMAKKLHSVATDPRVVAFYRRWQMKLSEVLRLAVTQLHTIIMKCMFE
ncbi:hypothetical protein CEXT_742041 [Caerostris extrusa]|uniref:Uncharacterized protein n=1 Tax=Caerostris extrusa TaxID=172846 RepID=A0AAV4SH69_CAEEX|nr:hypothetical protein CEXT_742041 [Caerostris extrusa]